MRRSHKKLLEPVCRLAVVLTLATAFSCSSDEDDGDAGNQNTPGATAGAAGQMVSFGGRASGGESSTAGTTGSGSTACENILDGMCGGSSIEANFKTVNILLVIDKSGSMVDKPKGFEVDKWTALKQALDTALADVAEDINFGLLLYPFSTLEEIPLDKCEERGNCCSVPAGVRSINVPIAPGVESVPQILGALDDTSPGGGTPTADALAGALEYFTVGEGADLPGEKYVLLATDGGPNCNSALSCEGDRCTTNLDGNCSRDNCCTGQLGALCLDDERVTENVEALAAEGIGTFVVGIPGTEAYASYLDGFARAGGFANPAGPPEYYAVSAEGGVEGLVDVFSTITTQLVRACDIELQSTPLDLERVNVYIDCDVVPKGEEGAESWEIDVEATPNLLRLKGSVCRRVERRGAERVDVIFGCPTIR